MAKDCLMVHSISSNTLNNAARFAYNSVQGHHHSLFGVERYSDASKLRWSMTVGCLLDPHSPAARYAQKQVLKTPILGVGLILGGKKAGKPANTLVISDLHLPYQHQDAFDFLRALHKKYKFTQILNVGDLYDHHRGSYHESEPDALSEEEGFYAAQDAALELQSIFPNMVITEGNHDAIPQRKLRTVGLPMTMVSDYNRLYGTEKTWVWKKEHWFDAYGGFPVTHPMVLNGRGRWDGAVM